MINWRRRAVWEVSITRRFMLVSHDNRTTAVRNYTILLQIINIIKN